MSDILAERADHGRDKVMDLFVAFQLEELRNGDTPVFANAAEIVAFQIGDHDQLGDFLGGSDEIVGIALIALRIRSPGTGALDRAGHDSAGRSVAESTRARRKRSACLQDREMRRMARASDVAAPRRTARHPQDNVASKACDKTHLVNVARSNVFLRRPHHLLELPLAEAGRETRMRGKFGSGGDAGKVHGDSCHLDGPCKKSGRFFVKAEPEASVEPDPSDGRPVREAEVRSGPLPRGQLALECVPFGRASLENQIGFTSQQRDRVCLARLDSRNTKPSRDLIARAASSGFDRTVHGASLIRLGIIIRKIPQSPGCVDVLLLEQSAKGCLPLSPLMWSMLRLFVVFLVSAGALLAQEASPLPAPTRMFRRHPSPSPRRKAARAAT